MDTNKSRRNIRQFDGERYSIWKFRLRAILAEEDALKVIDEEAPTEPDRKWEKLERLAKSIIIECLSDTIIGVVTEEARARQIIEKLDSIYERKSLATQLSAQKKLLSLKFKGDMELTKHFQMFDELMIELLAAGGNLTEMSKIAHLLLTLPQSYDGIVTAIHTLTDDSLSLAFVKTKLLDYETKIHNERSDTSTKVLHTERHQTRKFFVSNKNKYHNQKPKFSNQPTKRHYSNSGHKKFGSQNHNNMKCRHCGRKNHTIKDCYFYKKNQNKEEPRERTLQTVHTEPDSEKGFAFMVGNTALQASESAKDLIFILDSGATDHMVNQANLFTSYKQLDSPIRISVAKVGVSITATLKGTIKVTTDKGKTGVLEDVLYAAEIPYNLLSVRRIQEAGMTVIFHKNGSVSIKKNNETIIKGKSEDNLISVTLKVHKPLNIQLNVASERILNNYKLWHARLGHISNTKFLQLKNIDFLNDNKDLNNIQPIHGICEACIYGKQARLPFAKAKDKTHIKRPLFIVHSDVCGPITPPTIDEKNYFVTFIDDYTHYTVTYLLAYKSEVFKMFQDFVSKSEAHFNLKLANLYCDNGREYLSNEFKDYCVQRGISYHLTVPHTPQQNSIAERMNRSITEKARSMVHGAKLEKQFWGEAVLTATYLINLIPTKSLKQNKTPFELWHNKKPRIDNLKIFGSTAFTHNKIRKDKFDKKSNKGIMVGYQPNGYKILDIQTNKFIIARDVIFDETNFETSRPKLDEGVKTLRLELNELLQHENSIPNKMPKTTIKAVETPIEPVNYETGKSITKIDKSVIQTDNEHIIITSPDHNHNTDLRRSERIKNLPFISYNEEACINTNYIMCAQSLICKIPQTYSEIKYRDDKIQWEQAIQEEINSLLINNTWSLVDKPLNKNIVDCKWIFNIKNDTYGNPQRYKARLVARGFSQQYLLDYDETFAPVARISTFRLLIILANQYNLLLHQMDVKTAYLNGILNDEIYMRVPEGITAKENKVCKLHKSLYGLKQSARCWFARFDDVLRKHDFKNSEVDRCLYFLNRGHINKNIYVILYVDDVLIATGNKDTMISFKNYLKSQFNMEDMHDVKCFLGIKVERNKDQITLDQSSYLKTVLDKFNMTDCKTVNTPLPNKLNYAELNSDTNIDAPCRNLIGCLMYVMLCTRPDLCTAINLLSRYQSKNNKEIWQCLKRILRYIKGTLKVKLVYKQSDFNHFLVGYVDSDWGNNETDRRSTSGYIFKLFENCTISWNTKRQNSVAASSTEAEYMALFEGVREALWLKSLLKDINFNITEPITIFEDNNGCIAIANNPVFHKRSKHIDIKYHFTREQINNNVVILKYISTGNQLADAMTKPLPSPRFQELRFQMGLMEVTQEALDNVKNN